MTTTLPPYAYCLGARSSRQAGVAFVLLAASTTDPESRVMSASMGSFRDAQAEANAELVIVAAEVAGQRNDRTQLHR